MTDRELLELAAKAAGYSGNKDYMDGLLERWNPLENNNDCFDLIVLFALTVSVDDHQEETDAWGRESSVTQPHNNDPYAATRRAIVRAAAAIGEEQP